MVVLKASQGIWTVQCNFSVLGNDISSTFGRRNSPQTKMTRLYLKPMCYSLFLVVVVMLAVVWGLVHRGPKMNGRKNKSKGVCAL